MRFHHPYESNFIGGSSKQVPPGTGERITQLAPTAHNHGTLFRWQLYFITASIRFKPSKKKYIYLRIHERLQYQVFRIDLYGVSAQSAAITRTRQLLAAALTETRPICSTNDFLEGDYWEIAMVIQRH